jgi:hypothetical protein
MKQAADGECAPGGIRVAYPSRTINPKKRRIPAFSFFSHSPTLAKASPRLHFPPVSHCEWHFEKPHYFYRHA